MNSRDIDKLEELPTREPTHRHRPPKKGCACSYCQEQRGDNYPYHRVERWLRSRIGNHWDDVISEFIRLDWIPAEHRSYRKLCDHVYDHTFMRDGKVWMHAAYHADNAAPVDQEYSAVFYVDPRTGDLCYKKKTPRTRWSIRHEEEERKTMRILGDYHQLLRINGIWYEVRGMPEGTMFNARMYGPRVRMMWDKPNEKNNYAYMKHVWERPRIVLKRQLSKEDLQFHKLRNEIDNEFTRAMHYAGKQT